MDISSRILRLLNSVTADQVEQLSEIIKNGTSYLDEVLKEWEQKHGLDQSTSENQKRSGPETSNSQRKTHSQNQQSRKEQKQSNGFEPNVPKQIVEDLQLFGLIPPASLDEVKKARNREIKKFHPDKFLKEPEKIETAKRILQIYNAAYNRLKQELK